MSRWDGSRWQIRNVGLPDIGNVTEVCGADTTLSFSSPPRVILGGDLNAEPHEVVMLQRELATLGGALSRVVAPGDTGLSANFSTPESIDHIFISPGLRLSLIHISEPTRPY